MNDRVRSPSSTSVSEEANQSDSDFIPEEPVPGPSRSEMRPRVEEENDVFESSDTQDEIEQEGVRSSAMSSATLSVADEQDVPMPGVKNPKEVMEVVKLGGEHLKRVKIFLTSFCYKLFSLVLGYFSWSIIHRALRKLCP